MLLPVMAEGRGRDDRQEMIESIGKAVSGALSSVLSKIQSPHLYDDKDDFLPSRRDYRTREVNRERQGRANEGKQRPLPSVFLSSRKRTRKPQSAKVFTYHRDIICLPSSFQKRSGNITIPRSPATREFLAKNNLIGKICLDSSMDEDSIFREICSVFSIPMDNSSLFNFKVLQPAGGTSKSLTVPSLSASYKWTAGAICGKNSKVPIYILAVDDLKLRMEYASGSEEELPEIDLTKDSENENASEPEVKVKARKIQKRNGKQEKHKIPKTVASPVSSEPCTDSPEPYRAYVSLLDSDDEEERSPSPPVPSPLTPQVSDISEEVPLDILLQDYRRKMLPLDDETKTRIFIRRKHVFTDAFHKFRGGIDLNKHLSVTFSGRESADRESAVDTGGPLREFLRLLHGSMFRCNTLFCGSDASRVPTHNTMELEKRSYYFIGASIALCFLHGGPPPNCLSSAVADYIMYGIQNVKPTPEDIPDKVMRDKILKLKNASISEFRLLLDDEEYNFRYDLGIGIVSSSATMSDQLRIVDCMCKHYSILIIKAELDQLLCGLSSTLNFLYLLRENPQTFRTLFVYTPRPKMSGDKMYDLFRPTLSPEGSNQRDEEELVLMWWADIIYHIEECNGFAKVNSPSGGEEKFRFSLEDIVIFATGASGVPPIGFFPKPSITFHRSSCLPMANTCVNSIKLPLYSTEDYDVFKYNFVFGIMNSAGFGQV